ARWPDPPFFFSSRRRHTRLSRDWSSDVALPFSACRVPSRTPPAAGPIQALQSDPPGPGFLSASERPLVANAFASERAPTDDPARSEERRVGNDARAATPLTRYITARDDNARDHN